MNALSFSKKQFRLFISTMFAMFAVVTLQLFGIKPPKLINPLPLRADIYYDTVSPKLDTIANTYSVQEEHALIPQAYASGEFDEAAAYAVIDYDTGAIIASKNANKQLPIASITKVMTAVVALDLADPSEVFGVSQKASKIIPTKIAVEPGEEYTVKELLEAALLTSANDAVQVLREGIDAKYGDDVFIRAMNEKALLLGLQDSSFANPQGFDDPDNFSTVADVANLTHYALEHYPLIKEIAQKDMSELLSTEQHKRSVLYNWNGLIDVYPETIGMKIGNTGRAGKTTVVVSGRAGKKLISVVLGAPGIIERDKWAADLLDIGYENTLGLAKIEVTEDDLRAKYATWKAWQ